MHHCGRGKKLLKTWKRILVGEARNSLKLGSNSPSLNQESHFLVNAPRKLAEENCKYHVEELRE
jgi:hypothetical protein